MEGKRKRPSLIDEDEYPCSKYRRLDIQEGQQASSELDKAAGSSTSSLPEANNDFQDVITISSDSEDVSYQNLRRGTTKNEVQWYDN